MCKINLETWFLKFIQFQNAKFTQQKLVMAIDLKTTNGNSPNLYNKLWIGTMNILILEGGKTEVQIN